MYTSIDLKSFYASVECVERGLDPMTTNLVVADSSRTEKTICLAVTPSLKAYGLSGRSRLFEVESTIRKVNNERRKKEHISKFTNSSYDDIELKKNPNLEVSYIVAPPRMKLYMKYSEQIYEIYLKYVSEEDIFSYSIDEVFIDVSKYLNLYHLTAEELVTKMVLDVFQETRITATAGIGTNLYLSKVAMDILAKHEMPNKDGVRVAFLDEMKYKEVLWLHKPLSDFWRVGRGYQKKLEMYHIYTMRDIAKLSITNEDFLFKLFGVNAELLIDHSWGMEYVTIKDIKNYKSDSKSLCSGQVLHCAYDYKNARLVLREMAEEISLSMLEKKYVTDLLVLHIDYDKNASVFYQGDYTTDRYQRKVPKPLHGTERLKIKTNLKTQITEGFLRLYDRIINKNLKVKKINITVGNLSKEEEKKEEFIFLQFDLFCNADTIQKKVLEKEQAKQEKKIMETMLEIKNKYGKNAIFKGMNLLDGATTRDRNEQVGGHKG